MTKTELQRIANTLTKFDLREVVAMHYANAVINRVQNDEELVASTGAFLDVAESMVYDDFSVDGYFSRDDVYRRVENAIIK